jgi:hypothetical protein
VGTRSTCSSCRTPANREHARLYSRIYYRAHREKCIELARRFQERNRDKYLHTRREYEAKKIRKVIPLVLGHYSGGSFVCACCGQSERDFLTIDHVDGQGNRMARELGVPRGGSELYRWLVRNQFPSGFAVLCANFNSSKGKHGLCVHKRAGLGVVRSKELEGSSLS